MESINDGDVVIVIVDHDLEKYEETQITDTPGKNFLFVPRPLQAQNFTPKHRKWHFRGSTFQNFPGAHAPAPLAFLAPSPLVGQIDIRPP